MAIKAIIFDCFGVLVWAGHDYLKRDFPNISDEITKLQFDSDAGKISRQEFNDTIAKSIGLSPQQVDDKYWLTSQFNKPMIEWARELKISKKYKIGMLSNINRDWMDICLPFFNNTHLFDEIVLSGDVNLVKPNPEIFKLIASKLNILPNECVMIDDSIKNIEGAKRSGMHGIVYHSKEQLQTDLNKILEENNA